MYLKPFIWYYINWYVIWAGSLHFNLTSNKDLWDSTGILIDGYATVIDKVCIDALMVSEYTEICSIVSDMTCTKIMLGYETVAFCVLASTIWQWTKCPWIRTYGFKPCCHVNVRWCWVFRDIFIAQLDRENGYQFQ